MEANPFYYILFRISTQNLSLLSVETQLALIFFSFPKFLWILYETLCQFSLNTTWSYYHQFSPSKIVSNHYFNLVDGGNTRWWDDFRDYTQNFYHPTNCTLLLHTYYYFYQTYSKRMIPLYRYYLRYFLINIIHCRNPLILSKSYIIVLID